MKITLVIAALAVAIAPCWGKEASQLATNAMAVGDELYSSQKYEQALEEYEKAIVADPASWRAQYAIAMSYMALYHPDSTDSKDLAYADKSAEAFERLMALELPDPETSERVRKYYFALLMAAGKTDKAIAYVEDLIEKDPRNSRLVSQIAEIYAKKGDFDNALKYYMKRTEIEPTNKEAWKTMGVVCWDRVHAFRSTLPADEVSRTIETGIKALDKALSMDSGYFDALVYMNLIYREKALTLAAQMKNEEAEEALKIADDYRSRAEEAGKKRMAEQP